MTRAVRGLIYKMSVTTRTWGSPRISGQLRKLGIEVAKSTVEAYMEQRRKPSSPTWRTFLESHVEDLVSIDFFIVPSGRFTILFVFLVLAHHPRRVVHFNITSNPTAAWTAQQVAEAFPWDEAPRYLLRDRDGVYGSWFRHRVKNMGIEEVVTAARSPWQSPYMERLIGSIRRDCLDHVIVLGAGHLRRLLASYFDYYHGSRTHTSLDWDCPEPRPVQPPGEGPVIEILQVIGLHHRYERRAAGSRSDPGTPRGATRSGDRSEPPGTSMATGAVARPGPPLRPVPIRSIRVDLRGGDRCCGARMAFSGGTGPLP